MSDILGRRPCVRCGELHYGIMLGTDGLCPDCRGDDLALSDLERGETEFTRENEIRCPWCGKRVHHENDERVLRDGGEEECPHCGKRYDVTAECHWTYDTRRLEP